MVLTGSLQLSHGLGLHKNQGYTKTFKSGIGRRSKFDALDATLLSHVSFQRQHSWNVRVPSIVHRPLHTLPHRHNAFKCRSFLTPGTQSELPVLKTTVGALKRCVNILQGYPLVPKLAVAAGFTVFAAWGFLPLIRLIRNVILHQKNDNSWKKSDTHYILTSYLQPMLLWTGAMLICRTLDPVFLPTEASRIVKTRLLTFVRSLSTVLAFAYCLSSVIQQTQKYFMETHDPTDTRNMGFQFAGKAIYSAVWIAALSLFMELLGFSTQKWVTAGGLGTVLLTLAGREIFTNFLSSAMIHATRPFVVNEWIQTKIEGYEVSGTVEHVGWWSPTIIRGEDREAVHIPNHKFTVNVVRNLTQKTHWRIKTHLAISHLDVIKINHIVADMRKVLAKNPQVEQQRLHRRVFLENINPENQALMILISCFVKTSHFEEYLCVREAILLDLLRVISHHRARLATPIRTVQKIYSDADLENIPFAESVYNNNGVANRPLLLIEPAYKINGEDKTKNRNTARPNGDREKDGKTNSKESPKTPEKAAADPEPDTTANAPAQKTPTGKQPKSHNKGSTNSTPSVSKPVIEENIVLGVALEGSKRTLPIEDDDVAAPSLSHGDVTEMVAGRINGQGSSAPNADKDRKDSQIPSSPSSSSGSGSSSTSVDP